MIDQSLERRLSSSQLRLRARHPFFATLMMFATTEVSSAIGTAATDGKKILINESFVAKLSNDELDGLLVHEVLHMALLHHSRRASREAMRWNVACDIVINGMIVEAGLTLPAGAITDVALSKLSSEDVYERLPETKHRDARVEIDLIGDADQSNSETMKAYWNSASAQASVVVDRAISEARFAGVNPYGASREWREVRVPEIDWRTLLWSFMVRTPTDYSGFDRRFIGRGLYLDAVDGESVCVAVCIDTSASVSAEELSAFFAELKSIIRSYPSIDCELYFADAALYGPYQVNEVNDIPNPEGGGGTSFAEFFAAVASNPSSAGLREHFLAIYMTDGYALFPEQPDFPILWVLTSGGIDCEAVPYGSVAKLRET